MTSGRECGATMAAHVAAVMLVAAVALAGCVMEGGRGGGPGPGPAPRIGACPAGGTLRITLWDVLATPRRPDGDVWDGVAPESGLAELACSASADFIRGRVREAAIATLGGAGAVADALVGDAFEREVANACGLAADWLQMAFEGPDLAAYGAFEGDEAWQWESVQVEDTWVARLNTTVAGGPAAWDIPCDVSVPAAALAVVDRDVLFDDPLANMLLSLTVPDEAICDGWGYYEGVDGVAGVLVRFDVIGAAPVCRLAAYKPRSTGTREQSGTPHRAKESPWATTG